MALAIVFPGQGAQFVGMGKDLANAYTEAKEVFLEVNDALNEDLSKMMFDGSMEDLTLTQNTQPAMMAVSMAIIRVLQQQGHISIADTFRYCAGHSLGEYTAICVAGGFSITTCAKLLRKRGLAMQNATPVGTGAMCALLGADMKVATEIAKEAAQGEVCVAANDNAPGQVVLSGTTAAIDRAIEIAKNKGLKRTVKLMVSAPFHSPLMKPAEEIMKTELENAEIHDLRFPLITNVDAKAVWKKDDVRKSLIRQITGAVRWRESMLLAESNGVKTVVEVGAGKVLTGLTKKISPNLKTITINTPDDINSFIENWVKEFE
ncbi:MAG: ACP S-malonyltransferase [Alphaproteobacteria bacterium]|nr:ACP S-malonyltransferase [Alphaproteobacteria bacterium]